MAIVGFCAASAYGWFNGDPRKLLIGWDSDGNGCGYSDKTKDYGHLYWAQPPNVDDLMSAVKDFNVDEAMGILSTGTCVKECPSTTSQIECVETSAMTKVGSGFDGCVYNMDVEFITKLFGVDD